MCVTPRPFVANCSNGSLGKKIGRYGKKRVSFGMCVEYVKFSPAVCDRELRRACKRRLPRIDARRRRDTSELPELPVEARRLRAKIVTFRAGLVCYFIIINVDVAKLLHFENIFKL